MATFVLCFASLLMVTTSCGIQQTNRRARQSGAPEEETPTFHAAYLDYKERLAGVVTEKELPTWKKLKLDSLDQLQQHYCQTFVETEPLFVQQLIDPDWTTWEEWQVFREKYRRGDELWYFDCQPAGRGRPIDREGYLILRKDKLHALLMPGRVIFRATYDDYADCFHGIVTEEELLASKRERLGSLDELWHHYLNTHRLVDLPFPENWSDWKRWNITFGKWNEWGVFTRKYREGDELWSFGCGYVLAGRWGYLIIRDGKLHAVLVVATS